MDTQRSASCGDPASGDASSVSQAWSALWQSAAQMSRSEPKLAPLLNKGILKHDSFESALSGFVAEILIDNSAGLSGLREVPFDAYRDDPQIVQSAVDDLNAVVLRDPATTDPVYPFLFYRGYRALQCHRLSHWLWRKERCSLALFVQSRIVEQFSIDIHPAAKIGRGVMIDHGTGIVIGETAVVEDGVSLLHAVTLGGTGKESQDRHPKIRRNVLIGAGATILGNVEVGEGARVAAGSVVVKSVPAFTTVVGIPAQGLNSRKESLPSQLHCLPK